MCRKTGHVPLASAQFFGISASGMFPKKEMRVTLNTALFRDSLANASTDSFELYYADDVIPEVTFARQPVGKLVKIANIDNALLAMRTRRAWAPIRQVVFVCVVHADKARSSLLLALHKNSDFDNRCNFSCPQGELDIQNPSVLREARHQIKDELGLKPGDIREVAYIGSMMQPIPKGSPKRPRHIYQNFHCCIVTAVDRGIRPRGQNKAAGFFHTNALDWILQHHSQEKRELITAVVHAAVLNGYLPQKLFRNVV